MRHNLKGRHVVFVTNYTKFLATFHFSFSHKLFALTSSWKRPSPPSVVCKRSISFRNLMKFSFLLYHGSLFKNEKTILRKVSKLLGRTIEAKLSGDLSEWHEWIYKYIDVGWRLVKLVKRKKNWRLRHEGEKLPFNFKISRDLINSSWLHVNFLMSFNSIFENRGLSREKKGITL